MAHWLVKQEPTSYPWSRLVTDGRTRWDGVHNALALQHLRRMKKGDEALFYHSGDERACVGILRVTSEPRPDPEDDRRSWYVEVAPVRPLDRPVTLAEIRGDPAFAGIDLLRNSRLSVMPIPDAAWTRLLATAATAEGSSAPVRGGRTRPATRPAPPRRGNVRSRRR